MMYVKSVEQYLWYEFVTSFQVVFGVITRQYNQEYSARELLHLQMKKLSNAFHLFMMDLEVSEFQKEQAYKALQLPSEQKAEKESSETENTESGSSEGKQLGTQLQLFFVKLTKAFLSSLLSTIEAVISRAENLVGREREYTNTYKKE